MGTIITTRINPYNSYTEIVKHTSLTLILEKGENFLRAYTNPNTLKEVKIDFNSTTKVYTFSVANGASRTGLRYIYRSTLVPLNQQIKMDPNFYITSNVYVNNTIQKIVWFLTAWSHTPKHFDFLTYDYYNNWEQSSSSKFFGCVLWVWQIWGIYKVDSIIVCKEVIGFSHEVWMQLLHINVGVPHYFLRRGLFNWLWFALLRFNQNIHSIIDFLLQVASLPDELWITFLIKLQELVDRFVPLHQFLMMAFDLRWGSRAYNAGKGREDLVLSSKFSVRIGLFANFDVKVVGEVLLDSPVVWGEGLHIVEAIWYRWHIKCIIKLRYFSGT